MRAQPIRHGAGYILFGDYCSGELWAIRDIETAAPEIRKIPEDFVQIAAMGTDADGEIIVSDFAEGAIYPLELPSYDVSGWEPLTDLVQRRSVEARRAGLHSVKQELEELYSSKRWSVVEKVFDFHDLIVGKGAE